VGVELLLFGVGSRYVPTTLGRDGLARERCDDVLDLQLPTVPTLTGSGSIDNCTVVGQAGSCFHFNFTSRPARAR
jgi:hypothetical protein